MDAFGKAPNKRTGIKFYRSSHSLKNPSVGSLETDAGACLLWGPRQQETTSQPKWMESESGLTPWAPGPVPPLEATSSTADPSPAVCDHPPPAPRLLHPPSFARRAPPRARARELAGPRAHARTSQPLSAWSLPGPPLPVTKATTLTCPPPSLLIESLVLPPCRAKDREKDRDPRFSLLSQAKGVPVCLKKTY